MRPALHPDRLPDHVLRRGIRLILLTALVSCLVSIDAVAQSQPAPPTSAPPAPAPTTTAPVSTPPVAGNPGANTWSLSPTGKDPSQPGERTSFSHELAPGASVDDSATVWNYSDQDRVFDVYVRDAFSTSTGGIDILTKDVQSKDVGLWVALSTQQVRVPAHHGVTVPFSITVPRTATPGDHDAGIVASLVTAGDASGERRVVVDHRVGVRLYVRVTGALQPSLSIESFTSTYSGPTTPTGKGSVEVSYTVHNTGNVRLRSHQHLDVDGVLGWSLADRALDDLPELLPGASIARTERVDGVTPALHLSTTLTETPFAPKATGRDDAGAEPVAASASQWVVPWLLILLLVLLIAGWRLVRRIRGRRAPSGPAAGASGADDDPDPFDVLDLDGDLGGLGGEPVDAAR